MNKNSFSYLVTILSILLFTGCEKVKDLNTINFDADFSTAIECETHGLKSPANNPVFSASAVIEPTSDPNVNIYLNNIRNYDIQAVKATITSMSQENVTIISADLDIYNFQYDAKWTFQNELLTTGKTFTLGNENGQWDTVSSILKDGQEFTVIITGEADFSNITFTLKVDIETRVEANVL